MTRTPLVAWPAPAERPRAALLTTGFVLLFVVLFWGSEWLAQFVPWRLHVDFAWEQRIPFGAWAVWLYLSLDLLLLLAPFVLRTWDDLLSLWLVLVSETCLAALCFVLLPVAPHFASFVPPDGLTGVAFVFADAVNLHGNLLPSLHVAYAVTAALAYARQAQYQQRSSIVPIIWVTWALAIAVSTVVLRQHHVADVVTGLALGAAAWWGLGRWAHSARVRAALDVEWLCLENVWLFVRRHRRYATITLALAAASLPHWRRNRLLRTGFCALQAIDDLLDGDRVSDGAPLEIVQSLRAQIVARSYAADSLARLVAASVSDLEAAGGLRAVDDAVQLIDVMIRDYRRRVSSELLDGATLRAHHRETFTLSLNLMLLAGRCELRADDVPELIDALGWCSTVRDLDEDLAKGLVNIPKEVVAATNGVESESWSRLADETPVREWLRSEGNRARSWLGATEQRLAACTDRRGAQTLRRFARSMRRYLPPTTVS
ncbi:MAG: phosphatase PAP2 family protein [Gemmatimonadaceae bacterium]|nr:phosphatase PAP2 family protein [Gemmatimonadaceae bacterium]